MISKEIGSKLYKYIIVECVCVCMSMLLCVLLILGQFKGVKNNKKKQKYKRH